MGEKSLARCRTTGSGRCIGKTSELSQPGPGTDDMCPEKIEGDVIGPCASKHTDSWDHRERFGDQELCAV